MADKMRLCRHHRKPLKRHNAIAVYILIAPLSGSAAASVGLGRLENAAAPVVPWSPRPAGRRCRTALHRGLTPMPYRRRSATANRLTRSPLVHRLVINPFVFRLIFTSFATYTRCFSLTRLLGGDDWLFFNYGYEEDPPMVIRLDAADEPDLSIELYHRTATQVDLRRKAGTGVQLRPWRRGLISGAHSAPGFLHRTGLEPSGPRR